MIINPFTYIIFGASGDLARLKLFPSLYQLMEMGRLPQEFYIVGFARSFKERAEFQKEFEESINAKKDKVDQELLKKLLSHVYYYSGQYDRPDDYRNFKSYLDSISLNTEIVAYFSIPPFLYKNIIQNLGENFNKDNLKLVLEKPFGESELDARDLYEFIQRYFSEKNIFLLDHYLGKSIIRSIFKLRADNKILELLTNTADISNIQINALEDIGINNRIGYFNQVGIIKDMIQSHLLQLLALAVSPTYENISKAKLSVLSQLQFDSAKDEISIGQYEGYINEKDAPPDSKTETFAAIRLKLGYIPVFLRSGKKLENKHTYIVIEYKGNKTNKLTINISPEENIEISLNNNGEESKLNLEINIENKHLSEHAVLLEDILNNRKENFLTFEEILLQWKIIDNILIYIKSSVELEKYPDNSKGPLSQDKLMLKDNFKWN